MFQTNCVMMLETTLYFQQLKARENDVIVHHVHLLAVPNVASVTLDFVYVALPHFTRNNLLSTCKICSVD